MPTGYNGTQSYNGNYNSGLAYTGDWTGTLNGLPIGTGTPYAIAALDGWKSQTSAPLGGLGRITPRQTTNGAFLTPMTASERVITMTIEINSTATAFAAAVAALEAVTVPGVITTTPLTLQLDGIQTTSNVFVTERQTVTDLSYQMAASAGGVARVMLKFESLEVRRFGAALQASTGLPLSTGGLTWPATWPIEWNSTIISGQISLTNPGNATGPVLIQINGPVTSPTLSHVQSGLTVAFNGLTVNDGDFLMVDMENRVASYNGQSSRNSSISSRGWFGFIPGVNTFAFGAPTYSGMPNITVTATPAWI